MLQREGNGFASIAIIAGKGGVGKSALTVLLAHSLRWLGYRSAVFDGDLYGPSIRQMLPPDCMPRQEGEKIHPALSHSIPNISSAYLHSESTAVAVRAPIANMVITNFLQQVVWPEIDCLLFDFPPGTGDIPLTLSQKVQFDGAIFVTTPCIVAVNDARRAIELTLRLNIHPLGVVENMSFYQPEGEQRRLYPFGRGGGKSLATEFSLPLLAELPFSEKVLALLDRGANPFSKVYGESWPADSLQEEIVKLSRQLLPLLKARVYTRLS